MCGDVAILDPELYETNTLGFNAATAFAVAPDETTYVALDAPRELVALSPAGDERWRVPLGADLPAILVAATDGAYAAFGPSASMIVRFEAATGESNVVATDEGFLLPTAHHDGIFTAQYPGRESLRLNRLAPDGHVVWSRLFSVEPTTNPMNPTGIVLSSSRATTDGGLVVAFGGYYYYEHLPLTGGEFQSPVVTFVDELGAESGAFQAASCGAPVGIDVTADGRLLFLCPTGGMLGGPALSLAVASLYSGIDRKVLAVASEYYQDFRAEARAMPDGTALLGLQSWNAYDSASVSIDGHTFVESGWYLFKVAY